MICPQLDNNKSEVCMLDLGLANITMFFVMVAICLIFIISLTFLVSNLPSAFSKGENKVRVTAKVLEQINYRRNGDDVLIETNYQNGFWIILIIMGIAGLSMIYLFKRKKWL